MNSLFSILKDVGKFNRDSDIPSLYLSFFIKSVRYTQKRCYFQFLLAVAFASAFTFAFGNYMIDAMPTIGISHIYCECDYKIFLHEKRLLHKPAVCIFQKRKIIIGESSQTTWSVWYREEFHARTYKIQYLCKYRLVLVLVVCLHLYVSAMMLYICVSIAFTKWWQTHMSTPIWNERWSKHNAPAKPNLNYKCAYAYTVLLGCYVISIYY